jgi:hypothetical protein
MVRWMADGVPGIDRSRPRLSWPMCLACRPGCPGRSWAASQRAQALAAAEAVNAVQAKVDDFLPARVW